MGTPRIRDGQKSIRNDGHSGNLAPAGASSRYRIPWGSRCLYCGPKGTVVLPQPKLTFSERAQVKCGYRVLDAKHAL